MEYLELIKKYWSTNEEYPQTSSVTIIYLFLLNIWDKNVQKDFELSDNELTKILRLNRSTIKESKRILRDLGLISYQITKGFPTIYKIIPDYVIRKGKEVIPVAEKEKTVVKKTSMPVSPIPETISPVQEPIPVQQLLPQEQQVSITPAVEVVSPPLPPKPPKETPPPKSTPNINKPSFDEFMEYAKTLPMYEEGLDEHLKIKYEYWVDNGWISGFNKPIINWKQTLKSTMPYLTSKNKNIFDIPKIKTIPKINRPKATYDE